MCSLDGDREEKKRIIFLNFLKSVRGYLRFGCLSGLVCNRQAAPEQTTVSNVKMFFLMCSVGCFFCLSDSMHRHFLFTELDFYVCLHDGNFQSCCFSMTLNVLTPWLKLLIFTPI